MKNAYLKFNRFLEGFVTQCAFVWSLAMYVADVTAERRFCGIRFVADCAEHFCFCFGFFVSDDVPSKTVLMPVPIVDFLINIWWQLVK